MAVLAKSKLPTSVDTTKGKVLLVLVECLVERVSRIFHGNCKYLSHIRTLIITNENNPQCLPSDATPHIVSYHTPAHEKKRGETCT